MISSPSTASPRSEDNYSKGFGVHAGHIGIGTNLLTAVDVIEKLEVPAAARPQYEWRSLTGGLRNIFWAPYGQMVAESARCTAVASSSRVIVDRPAIFNRWAIW